MDEPLHLPAGELDELRHSVDPYSETALALKQWAAMRITQHDALLHQIGLPLDDTEGLRYAIRELGLVIDLLTAPDEG